MNEWIEPSGKTDLTQWQTRSPHKSTKTMIFLDELSESGPTHPLSPTYLTSKGATTNKLWSSHQWQTGGRSKKGENLTVHTLRQSLAVPAQLSRSVKIRLGNCLVLNLCRQASKIGRILTFASFFYKAFNTFFLCLCYTCFNCVAPVKTFRSQLFQTCTTYITFSQCTFDII